MLSDAHARTCDVCGTDFTTPRGPGRPPARCSDACNAVAHQRRRSAYLDRRIRREAAALLTAQAALLTAQAAA